MDFRNEDATVGSTGRNGDAAQAMDSGVAAGDGFRASGNRTKTQRFAISAATVGRSVEADINEAIERDSAKAAKVKRGSYAD